MESETSKSGATDTKDTSSSDATGKGSLDSLLEHVREFDKATQANGRSASSKESDELAALRKEVADLREVEADRNYRREMDEFLVPTVKGELEVHPKLVEAWLNEQAGSDSKLAEAWENRGKDRAAFEEAVAALVPKFEAYAEKEGIKGTAGMKGKPDPALQAALRNARSTRSESGGVEFNDLGELSDTQFALRKSEIFRLSKNGQLQ